MPKKAKTAIKDKSKQVDTDAKSFTKVIRAIKSPKTGSYAFKEGIVHKDHIKEYLSGK